MEKKHIYLDHAASTPVRQKVLDVMLPYWTHFYGNPSSTHSAGRQASRGLEEARKTIAELLNASPNEVIFTGCGSESDNLAIRGVMWAARESGQGNHLITCEIEHKAVLETAKQLRDLYDFEVTVLPVDKYGRINLDQLKKSIRSNTVLISIMAANNEIGTFQPIEEIGQIAREYQVLFHSDAIQAAAYKEWDLQNLQIDLLSFAPHKFYGPKGIGILYSRKGIEFISSLTGGGQENNMRAGTVNVPYAVGAAEAFRLALDEREENEKHSILLRDRLTANIRTTFIEDCLMTGDAKDRLPNNASFAFRDISGNDILMHLDMLGISASSGSACLTGNPEPSKVLEAIGLGEEWTKGGLRLTVGRQNTIKEIDYVLEKLPNIINNLKKLSAVYT